MKDADEFYTPVIKKDVFVSWIAAETIPDKATGEISIKGFKTSLQSNFSITANGLMWLFGLPNSINQALILIDKNNTAKIYSEFPLSMLMGAKKDMEKGIFVFKKDVFDITKLEFKDAIYEIKINPDDKIIFLFRVDWQFGLFYDFTQEVEINELKQELGYFYKRLFYYELYSFIENKTHFNNLLNDGWFPFIRLIGDSFDKIISYYEENKKHSFLIDDLVNSFTEDKIQSFTQYWWGKQLFKDKKDILETGINSFLQNNKNGFIACVHTLYPQIEGIMGLDYFSLHNKKPSYNELKEHIKKKGETKFDTVSSTWFPSEFYRYLNQKIFKNFDISTGDLELSRHTTSHGYANSDDFNKAKALQAILILDQIYFYL
jgi:hypothetical protein